MGDPREHLSVLWAKLSRRDVQPATFHPLICHCLDVAAVALALWDEVLPPDLRARAASKLGIAEGDARSWIAFWSATHDVGKGTPSFLLQDSRWRDRLRAAGFTWSDSAGKVRHGEVSAVALADLLPSYGLSPEMARQVATVVGGHHGVFPRSVDLQSARRSLRSVEYKGWTAAREALVASLSQALQVPRDRPPVALDNATAMVLAGLASVADWIGSDEKLFRHLARVEEQEPAVDPAAYLDRALGMARKALDRLGWRAWPESSEERAFRELFPGIENPNPLQVAAVNLAERLEGPCLVILEAPMGEGKTEAAIYLADRWAARTGRKGIYFALPTMATSDQMFGRVAEYLKHRFAGQEANLQLLHGHAALSAEFDLLRKKADHLLQPGGVEGEEGHDRAPAGVLAAEWFTYRKRGLLAPFGVGTVDQALLAALQTRHVFVRLFGLAGKTVILDEVHAYDTYMAELLDRLLEWLAALGTSVVLLSATLPAGRRRRLAEAYGRGLGITLAPGAMEQRYPRIGWVSEREQDGKEVDTSPRARKEVGLEWVDKRIPEDPDEPFDLGGRLAKELANGGCAAVICNTVGRAQKMYLALKPYFKEQAADGNPELDLLHARYLFQDRQDREKRALRRFGKPGGRVVMPDGKEVPVLRPHRAVLVATQLIEQSLDLDFDLMVSDMAPVDLLLQRVGRLHRHQRTAEERHGLAEPRLWLIGPEVGENGVPRFDEGTAAVYDGHVLLRSWLALREVSILGIPEDVERLVEEVYDESGVCPIDLGSALQDHWAETWTVHLADVENEAAEARDRWLKRPGFEGALWRFAGEPREEDAPDFHQAHQAMTRLAAPTVSVVCLHRVGGRLRLDPAGADVVSPMETPDTAMAGRLLSHSVSISHRGVVPWLRAQSPPTGWRTSPLLRHCRLVELDPSGAAVVGKYVMQIDPDLGVTFSRL